MAECIVNQMLSKKSESLTLERRTGLEPATFSLEGRHSTTELPPQIIAFYYNREIKFLTKKASKKTNPKIKNPLVFLGSAKLGFHSPKISRTKSTLKK